MSSLITKEFKLIYNKLLLKAKNHPLHSHEVVQVSQQLDQLVLQAMKK